MNKISIVTNQFSCPQRHAANAGRIISSQQWQQFVSNTIAQQSLILIAPILPKLQAVRSSIVENIVL